VATALLTAGGSLCRGRPVGERRLEEADVKELVEDITSVLFIIAAGGLGLWFITVAVR
jgi:hypothetical protein